jgi:hypothetical protein
LVNLIDNWEILKEYTGGKLGFYQLRELDGNFEIRVVTGRLGFKKEYADANDKEFKEILEFCKIRRFIQVSQYLREDEFFR